MVWRAVLRGWPLPPLLTPPLPHCPPRWPLAPLLPHKSTPISPTSSFQSPSCTSFRLLGPRADKKSPSSRHPRPTVGPLTAPSPKASLTIPWLATDEFKHSASFESTSTDVSRLCLPSWTSASLLQNNNRIRMGAINSQRTQIISFFLY